MKVIGLWSGHDASYCVLENGIVKEHVEWERHIREKEPAGDSVDIFLKLNGDLSNIDSIATVHKSERIVASPRWSILTDRGLKLHTYGHHQAHAANAFYSSNFDKSIVLTIDGGGIESSDGLTAAASAWVGNGTTLDSLFLVPDSVLNIGGVWTRATRYVFRYESGWPQGHQAGTVMALSALGNSSVWYSEVRRWFYEDHALVLQTPIGHVRGMSAKDPQSPKHPYLQKFEAIASESDQSRYDLAAALQRVTEECINTLIQRAINACPGIENICLSGGVALNSVAMGKLWQIFPQLKGVFIPPVPYDGGLCIGAAQYHWHHVLGNSRVKWQDNATPYLGIPYSEQSVSSAIESIKTLGASLVHKNNVEIDDVIDLLSNDKIVAVYQGRAESGRRALGNRSILADPRSVTMKDRVNHKVKHRQWFRPFAPSVLREDVAQWFERDIDSPYMSFVVPFNETAHNKVPAVVHFDGSARLQTVTARDNPWYHNFLTKWKAKTGIPIILNTSFNDREPICETPEHALKCFLGTEIDFLYFVDYKILVFKAQP